MSPLRLGLAVGYGELEPAPLVETARFIESLGFDSLWTSEAYGADAVVPLTWVAAHTERLRLGTGILQMAGRTPSMTAMTAMTLDAMSGGRLLLGLGVSGPQVVEGWHGQPYGKPLQLSREYVAILRAIWSREAPLEFDGTHFQIPYRGAGASGLGRPLKSILKARRDIPVYLAAISPRNIRLATEIADGVLPYFWSPAHWQEAFGAALAGADLSRFDVAPRVQVQLGEDLQACRDALKPQLALYVGGMGARGRNFYNDAVRRLGFEEAARTIQDHFLEGRKNEATAAVPDALVDEVALVGPKSHMAEQLEAWKASPVSTLVLSTAQRDAMAAVAEIVL